MLCRVWGVLSVGGFDEDFFLYSEEEDLCRRLGMCGWQTLFVPSLTLTHEHSTSSDGIDGSIMAPFRFHSLYWYYRKYHSRGYAEFARCTISACVAVDRAYRALTHQRQVYGPGTAIAAFRSIDSVRGAHARYMTGRRTSSIGISRIVRRRVGIRVRWSACAHTGCGYGPFAAYVQLHQRHGRHSTREMLQARTCPRKALRIYWIFSS